MKTPKTKRPLSRAESTTATQRKITAMLAKESPADRNASLLNSAAQLLTEFADGSIEDRDLSVVAETIKELLTLAAAQTAPAPAAPAKVIVTVWRGIATVYTDTPQAVTVEIVDLDAETQDREKIVKRREAEIEKDVKAGKLHEIA